MCWDCERRGDYHGELGDVESCSRVELFWAACGVLCLLGDGKCWCHDHRLGAACASQYLGGVHTVVIRECYSGRVL